MNFGKNLLYLMFICIGTTSCIITDDARSTQIEIMKPGLFNFPENIKTVALINTVSNNNDNSFRYDDGQRIERDTTITYRDLSNTCIDALAWALKKEGYFSKVINYRDSLTNISLLNVGPFYPKRLFQKTKSDLCIFLNDFDFNIAVLNGSDYVVENIVSLSWTIIYKMDTLAYTYKQRDTLTFTAIDFPSGLADNMKIRMVANNSSTFLGRTFCSKIIPTWIPVDRFYYTSNNRDMLQAEKYAKNNNWLQAAALWNKQTKNKNLRIAAKASYNMALACEMEGNPDAAIDWLIRSHAILKKNNETHKMNCQHYINTLVLRKKEIEKLGQQVRKNDIKIKSE